LIVIPYLNVVAQGDEVLGPAILWGAITGSLLVPAYTGLGMLVSYFANSNKTSYFVSLGIYILFLVPAQLPGRAQTGAAGTFLQWVNPVAAVNHFLSKHLVNYRTVAEFWTWLIAPASFFLIVMGILFLYAAPGLRLEGGRSNPFKKWFRRGTAAVILLVLVSILAATPVLAQDAPNISGLQIAIDKDYMVVKTSDKVLYNTVITNASDKASQPLIVAMNVINLDAKGDVVDPEDWSPQRTQYISALGPGESTTLSWQINTILDGDYMVYMVVIDSPTKTETTSHPVASSGIHLTVTPFTRLNPLGVLPYAIGGPLIIGLAIFFLYRMRRRNIDEGADA
jgi:hypothetical protein